MLVVSDIGTIVEAIRQRGLDYSTIFDECYKRYATSHIALSNWSKDDFALTVKDGKVETTNDDARAVFKSDTAVCV